MIRNYCLTKKEVTESFPFDEEVLVFKVAGKMFCLINSVKPFYVNLKCDPEKAIELREEYEEIKPGYHMNKSLWNSVYLTGSLTDSHIKEMIDNSYKLIVESLKKKDRERILGS
ncbi:MAG: MmcQ/YjbR family DNA-binding protein [Melioribacteraceae bacterium]|nr:MmcQ/YjbR family DNA-binding protein [Melioribacteraceae bacterium]MCF8430515.1 MmcQ/YjbR family DNA-binding protein [Melioribacteraceae bacterium]